MTNNETLHEVLATVQTHISTADQKAAALLTIAGVLIAFPAPSILLPASADAVPFPAAVCAAFAALGFVVSICCALAVLFPRTDNRTNTSSLIYFGDIAGLSQTAYVEAVHRADDSTFRDDLVAQIHANAKIAQRKHKFFKAAVNSLVAGVVLLTVAYGAIAWVAKPPEQKSSTPVGRTTP